MCKIAVKQNGLTLEFVQQRNKTKEICDTAIEQNHKASKFINSH